MRNRPAILRPAFAVLSLCALAAVPPAAADLPWQQALAWPEPQRAFLQDGPGWLLDDAQQAELAALDEAARQAWIDAFLARDPLPETPANELAEGIAARRGLALAELPSPTDVRARLLFLHGPPPERLVVDCATTYRPLELWSWRDEDATYPVERRGDTRAVIVYQPAAGEPWRLWLPEDAKRALYSDEMEYYLDQWEELVAKRMLTGPRFDRQACRWTRRVERVTGVLGLTDYRQDRPTADDYLALLAPPADLAAWAARAAAGPRAEAAAPLELGELAFGFPTAEGQRVVARLIVPVPAGSAEVAVREGPLAIGADRVWGDAFGAEEEGEGGTADDGGDAAAGGEEGADAPPRRRPRVSVGVGEPGEEAGAGADPGEGPAALAADSMEARDAAGGDEAAAGAEEAAAAVEPAAADAGGEPAAGVGLRDRELRLVVEGLIETDGRVHESFRVRFRPDAPQEGRPVALVLDRPLRPGAYLARLDVRDEVSGRRGRVAGAFEVPAEPRPEELPVELQDVVVALGEELARVRVAGADSLLLVPPEEAVVLGLWRADALVTGERIARVTFLVDGVPQLTRSRAPFSAELRLDRLPREQVVRAEGYDAAGMLVAADEVVINQPRGQLRVRIVEPTRGARVRGDIVARAEVTVPDGRRVARVEFRVNDEVVATRERPPWEAPVSVGAGDELVYLAVAALLDDGARAEDVRFLNAPGYMEELDVSLVELYVAAAGRDGRPVRGLTGSDFQVLEDGRPQVVSKFEEVSDLPLAVGLVIDTSGSMESSLAEAQRAAEGFLRGVVEPGDTAFAVAFSNAPRLLVAPTDDVDAVADALSGLRADGWTVLHDALVTSLYYFRGLEGQKALVLLSDGDDTASSVPFEDALEYARRMNAAVYTIGLGVGMLDVPVRRKLDKLAETTGGRSFFVSQADELAGVYEEIERELRDRYLLAYTSDRPRGDGAWRKVQVKVARPGVSGRTIEGYYP